VLCCPGTLREVSSIVYKMSSLMSLGRSTCCRCSAVLAARSTTPREKVRLSLCLSLSQAVDDGLSNPVFVTLAIVDELLACYAVLVL
jgi:hypothetical protein